MRARLLLALLFTIAAYLPASGGTVALAQSTPDPGTPGSRAISRTSYSAASDEAFFPTGWSSGVELRARVIYPTALAGAPLPLVLLLHGRHVTCFAGQTVDLVWPCPFGSQSIDSYLGYDYLGDLLASQGFIVVSVSANGINAADDDDPDGGMTARAELVNAHLQIWSGFNTRTDGAFGSLFTGKVNLNNIGLMGHSRGGEGVVRFAQLNAGSANPFGVKAVFPLAPVNFNRYTINNIPLATLLPYCDGDVSDLQGVHFYDDTRYNVGGDTAGKYNVLVMGANHNFYNTVWTPGSTPGGSDDWLSRESRAPRADPNADDTYCHPSVAGNQRLSAAQQRGTGLAYMAAFFRVYLRQETPFAPILQGDATPPASAQTSAIRVSYHAPGTSTARRDINRLLSASHLATNALGGAVTTSNIGFYDLCGGDAPQPAHCLSSTTDTSFEREPHTGVSNNSTRRGLSQLSIRLPNPAGSTAVYRNAIPAASGDVTSFARLQFRVSTVWGNALNPAGVPQNFRVILTDSAARTAAARVSDHSDALYYPPGSFVPVQPKSILNMVRIPLAAFGGVDLHNIRSVEFRFDQTASAWLLISDLAFANPVPAIASVSGVAPVGATVGSPVTISGTNLTGVSSVRFNGTTAAFTVDSTAQVTATVPAGATTGPISVVTALGTVTSPSNFNVYVATGNVGVSVARQPATPPAGGPVLRATFTARATCGAISRIEFGDAGQPLDNASVSVLSPAGGPTARTTGFTYTPPAGTTTVQIGFQRIVQAGDATIRPIHVVDGCSTWNTFVGGGDQAFK
jgi:hypothetical protein